MKEQRRDHKPVPAICYADGLTDCKHAKRCAQCGDFIFPVTTIGYDRSKPVMLRRTESFYWRHLRRWHKREA